MPQELRQVGAHPLLPSRSILQYKGLLEPMIAGPAPLFAIKPWLTNFSSHANLAGRAHLIFLANESLDLKSKLSATPLRRFALQLSTSPGTARCRYVVEIQVYLNQGKRFQGDTIDGRDGHGQGLSFKYFNSYTPENKKEKVINR